MNDIKLHLEMDETLEFEVPQFVPRDNITSPDEARERITRLIKLADTSEGDAEKNAYLECAMALERKGEHTGPIFYNVVDAAAIQVKQMYDKKANETKVITLTPVPVGDTVDVEPQLVETELILPVTLPESVIEEIPVITEVEVIEEITDPREIVLSPELLQMLDTALEPSKSNEAHPSAQDHLRKVDPVSPNPMRIPDWEPFSPFNGDYIKVDEVPNVEKKISTMHIIVFLLAGAVVGISGWIYGGSILNHALLVLKAMVR